MDKFKKGDKIVDKRYGEGVVISIDPDEREFRYNVLFKDGTKAWISGNNAKAF